MAVISEESLPGRRQIQRRLGDLGVNDPSGVAQMVTDPNIFKPDDQLGFASLLVEAEKADQQTREKFVQKWNELGTDQVEWLGHVNDYWRRFGGDSEKTLAVMVSDIHGSDDTMFQRVAMTCPELRGILMWLHFQRAKFLKGKITETQWDAAVDKAKSDVANLTGAQKDAVDNLVVQLTGDLFSKGTRAFARLEEVKTLMDILGEANAGDRLGGGVGMVYGNHEWIVNSFLTNPNRAKALKFFSGWYEGKDGWKFFDELAERFQRPDTHLNKRWSNWKRTRPFWYNNHRKDYNVLEGVGFNWRNSPTGVRHDKIWAFMKDDVFDPTETGKGSLGQFFAERVGKLVELRKIGDRYALYTHGDLTKEYLTELKKDAVGRGAKEWWKETDPDQRQDILDKNRKIAYENVKRINQNWRTDSDLGDYGNIFGEWFHPKEAGKQIKGDLQEEMKKNARILAMLGIEEHYSGHTPQTTEGGGQKVIRVPVKYRGRKVAEVGYYKIDIGEEEHTDALNAVAVRSGGGKRSTVGTFVRKKRATSKSGEVMTTTLDVETV
jgi:hypothetical protein